MRITTLAALAAAGLFSLSTAVQAVPASLKLARDAASLANGGTLAGITGPVVLNLEFDTDIAGAPDDGTQKLFDFGTNFINALTFDPDGGGVQFFLGSQTRIEVLDDFILPAFPGVPLALVGATRDVLGFEGEFFRTDGAYVASVFLAFAADTFGTPTAYPTGTAPELAILRLTDLGYGLDGSPDESQQNGLSIGAIELQSLQVDVTPVPVPAALPLLGGALGLLALFRRRV